MSDAPADILLGVTGSIAAYKAVEVVRLLLKSGARVQVILTKTAERFVGRATFSGLTGRAVHSEMFDAPGELHLTLASLAPTLLVVPASADCLARMAQGRANDLLMATLLCFEGQRFVAPAMHPSMWKNPATQRNVEWLRRNNVHFLGPDHGELASGDVGLGRLLAPSSIAESVWPLRQDLVGRRILISAGPTVEAIDPVRFMSNASSGKMGFALASEAARRGARVELFTGPVSLETPSGVFRHDVTTATQLLGALRSALTTPADALFMAAAVSDFRVVEQSPLKLKRQGPMTLDLVENPDIVATLAAERRGTTPLIVAFALETGDDAKVVSNAREKLTRKGVDAVVANSAADALGSESNRIILVRKDTEQSWPRLPKAEVAGRLLTELFATRPIHRPS